ERVRARTMAMHHSSELADTATILFQQIKELGFEIWSCGFGIWKPEVDLEEAWMSTGDLFPIILIPFKDDPTHLSIYEASQRGESAFEIEVKGEVLTRHYDWLMSQPSFKKVFGQIENSGITLPTVQYKYAAFFKQGYLHLITTKPQPDIQSINQRFAKVFEQTYTRFLDLQKAEALAREAKIEVALERIRASAMAMHSSEGILEVTQVLREQIALLGEKELESILVHIYHEDIDQFEAWYSYRHPENRHEPIRHGKQLLSWSQTARARKDKEKYYEEATDYTLVADNRMLKEWYDYLLTMIPEVVEVDKEGKPLVPNVLYYNYSKIAGGSLLLITNSEASDHSKYLLRRAATVFNLAYSRFLDLQKAEAQAREAQIEAALERVRSRTMAMQRSEELPEVAAILFQQVKTLGVPQFHCGFNIFEIDDKECTWYPGSADGDILPSCKIPLTEHPVFMAFNESRKRGDELFVYEKEGEYQAGHYRYMLSLPVLGEILQNMLDAGIPFPTFQIDHVANFSHGNLLFITSEHFPEMHDTFKRFAKVFEQTYTRFLDLQKAEAQAREAQIEVSLERVRARAMAMQRSEELKELIGTVFTEMTRLDIALTRTIIMTNDPDTRNSMWWMANQEAPEQPMAFPVPYHEHPPYRAYMKAWEERAVKFMYVLEGQDKVGWDDYLFSETGLAKMPDFVIAGMRAPERVYLHASFNNFGNLTLASLNPLTDEHFDILLRFAKVFDLTYTRFNDLRIAELQTHKAKIETALERVRARALAMQAPEELMEVSKVLRYEMGLLGVEELETCSIYLHSEASSQTECWYAIKDTRLADGKLVSDHFTLDLNDTWVGREMLSFFSSEENKASIIMKGRARKEWINYCEQRSAVLKGYYGTDIPDRTYHLYKFSHGAIGAAAAGDISAESWDLLQRAAAAFSLAYSRFRDLTQARHDLQNLKEEKQRAEAALTELKAAQTQLIQAEKMASLGELTAGIAHEIQNPLNFVNNFSEVNIELTEEIIETIEQGNFEEAKELAADIRTNQEKIREHGKRADGIVKSMLQHSRTSTGQKELRDLNLLADEYLRLSYHGMRAKDKLFNSDFELVADPDLPMINIVPQDIGRVILNLINNGFYAVHEKKKVSGETFKPKVTVTVTKLDDHVKLLIADNGTGITDKVKEKIFQPFFTTKPTGEGTGLGLSLSYDIVTKGHGGTISVDTSEHSGTRFTILLPFSTQPTQPNT
ncbi:MAG TPA: ATP-binding protein, partial [Chitinophagaceae bacterium]|nr:ATP-binding protein [Chitinophagaceae bacterium]